MSFKNWNYRFVPLFKEEFPEKDSPDCPSIKDFQEKNIYDDGTRTMLKNYLSQAVPLIATSFRRFNPYDHSYKNSLSYFTDGEVIFNNFLLDYIGQDDFALPVIWFNLIREKKFIPDRLSFDSAAAINEKVDIFKTTEQTFSEIPDIKKVLSKRQ